MGTASAHSQATKNLEAIYGGPSSEGFGSAVFSDTVGPDGDLEQAAVGVYRGFVGKLWERWGEDAWMSPWNKVFERRPGASPGIVDELGGISDPAASISVPLLLDAGSDPEQTRVALADAFDDPAVTEFRAYTIGDGGAMSGLLVAGRRSATGEATFLAVLMD